MVTSTQRHNARQDRIWAKCMEAKKREENIRGECSSSDREAMITYAGKILDDQEEFNDKHALAELVLKCTSKKGTMHDHLL